MLCPAELRDRWRRYNRISLGSQMRKFFTFYFGKNHLISFRDFNGLRATEVLGNRCSIRLSYGTKYLIILRNSILPFHKIGCLLPFCYPIVFLRRRWCSASLSARSTLFRRRPACQATRGYTD